ncbi:MAG: RnfABCDGE type electron transport complex subunit G [Proteobacteria bacterium]|nr:RnfABCDGE type electron transport complex subunit G [Pseudomonadota bacterium]
MRTSTKMFIVLTLISVCSGGLLSALNNVTAPRIKEHKLRELKASIADVLPKHDYYDEISKGPVTLYVGKKNEMENPVGVAFRVVGSGFQGKISIMVGVKPDFKELVGIKVLEHAETPGLGDKIVEDPSSQTDPFWFSTQFKDLKIEPRITVIKNVKPSKPAEIQAISGATISSKAIVKILNNEIGIAKGVYRSKNR